MQKKTVYRGGKNDKATNMLRNFRQIYEQDQKNKVKNEFRDLSLKVQVKSDDQYLVNLRDVSPLKSNSKPRQM